MAEAITAKDRAIEIANQIEGTECEITHTGSFTDRHEFDYEGGCVQAHLLPDDWEFMGFGSRWFAIRQA